MSFNIVVRRLRESDAKAFQDLRREGLENEPSSFGESVEEFLQTSVESWAERLRSGGDYEFIIGAFDGTRMIGAAGFYREKREKRRHKGTIWGVYTTPEYRGRGVARRVLTKLLETARAIPGLDCIKLTVSAMQTPARLLYVSLGFQPFGIEPKALKVQGCCYDEEHMILEL